MEPTFDDIDLNMADEEVGSPDFWAWRRDTFNSRLTTEAFPEELFNKLHPAAKLVWKWTKEVLEYRYERMDLSYTDSYADLQAVWRTAGEKDWNDRKVVAELWIILDPYVMEDIVDEWHFGNELDIATLEAIGLINWDNTSK